MFAWAGGGPALDTPPPEEFGRKVIPFRRYVVSEPVIIPNLPLLPDAPVDTLFPDDSITVYRPLLGYPSVVFTGKYADPIPLLQAVVDRDQANADAYNWLAYATRQNGDPLKAIGIYQQALDIDPKHRGAHEYIGEAYLQLNDLARAKEHLATLDKLCFFPCSEYSDLKKAIQEYEKKAGANTPSAGR